MGNWDKIQAVQSMQDYIVSHAETEIDMNELAAVSGYSRYHAIRLFKQYTGQTPSEYIRALRLSQAAIQLRDTNGRVLETALDTSFESHDGFTRAFSKQFGIGPAAYQKVKPPISRLLPKQYKTISRWNMGLPMLSTSRPGSILGHLRQVAQKWRFP